MKTISKGAALEYGWGIVFNPFFGFKKLLEEDPYEGIVPFPLNEQWLLIQALPDHWKPYFQFAFATGLRQGEEIGIKPEDIDWDKSLIHIRRAITRDLLGKPMEGRTKNRYSRRTIKLIPIMLEPLLAQKLIYEKFGRDYFFCTPSGDRIDPLHLSKRVWLPALKKAGIKIREMKQIRHTFATMALSSGENPLRIAKVLGHRNTEMLIKVYSKYIENANGTADGENFSLMYKELKVA
ncbi:MAG: site-specific integrase [Thermodesulfobacteriota bacterium]